jgi:hypothetical protein
MSGWNMTDEDMQQWCAWFRDHLNWIACSKHTNQKWNIWASDVNFSENWLTAVGVSELLETLAYLQVDVVVLKLFKNQISNGKALATYLGKCNGSLHEIHLSHNDLDAESAVEIIVAAASATNQQGHSLYPWRAENAMWSARCGQPVGCPLWLRLEHNYVDYQRLNDTLDAKLSKLGTSRDRVLCEAAKTSCTSRLCTASRQRRGNEGGSKPMAAPAVHVPYIWKQREAVSEAAATSTDKSGDAVCWKAAAKAASKEVARGGAEAETTVSTEESGSLATAHPKRLPTLLTKAQGAIGSATDDETAKAKKAWAHPRIWKVKATDDQREVDNNESTVTSRTVEEAPAAELGEDLFRTAIEELREAKLTLAENPMTTIEEAPAAEITLAGKPLRVDEQKTAAPPWRSNKPNRKDWLQEMPMTTFAEKPLMRIESAPAAELTLVEKPIRVDEQKTAAPTSRNNKPKRQAAVTSIQDGLYTRQFLLLARQLIMSRSAECTGDTTSIDDPDYGFDVLDGTAVDYLGLQDDNKTDSVGSGPESTKPDSEDDVEITSLPQHRAAGVFCEPPPGLEHITANQACDNASRILDESRPKPQAHAFEPELSRDDDASRILKESKLNPKARDFQPQFSPHARGLSALSQTKLNSDGPNAKGPIAPLPPGPLLSKQSTGGNELARESNHGTVDWRTASLVPLQQKKLAKKSSKLANHVEETAEKNLELRKAGGKQQGRLDAAFEAHVEAKRSLERRQLIEAHSVYAYEIRRELEAQIENGAARAHAHAAAQALLQRRISLVQQIEHLQLHIQNTEEKLLHLHPLRISSTEGQHQQHLSDIRQLSAQVSHLRAQQLALQRRLAAEDQTPQPYEQLRQVQHMRAQEQELLEEANVARLARQQHGAHVSRQILVNSTHNQQRRQRAKVPKSAQKAPTLLVPGLVCHGATIEL